MKTQLFRLLIHSLWINFLLFSCKEEVSPIDKFVGVYDYYLSGIPGHDENGNFAQGEGRLSVRKVNNHDVSFSIYEAENTNASWVFPHCEIIKIDTTGDKYLHYARILDKDKNIEIGKIRNWYESGFIPPFERVLIDMDFTVENNRHIDFRAMKRK